MCRRRRPRYVRVFRCPAWRRLPLWGENSMDGSRRFRRVAAPSAIMIVAPLCLLAVSTPPTWAARATGTATHGSGYAAEIPRTEYGIPHVLAGSFGDLGFGYGYAFAQDTVCAMADQILTLRGERSKSLDPAASLPTGSSTAPPTLRATRISRD